MRGARAPCLCLLLLGACSAVQAQFDLFGGLTGLTGGLINTGSSLVTGGTGLGTGFSVGGLGIGTPVYTTPAAASAPAAAAAVPAAGPTTYSTNNLLGWLFPVFTPARRDNCVVYEVRGMVLKAVLLQLPCQPEHSRVQPACSAGKIGAAGCAPLTPYQCLDTAITPATCQQTTYG